MAKTAINLYSVRNLDEPMLDILDRAASAGYDGVQFSGGLRDASPEDVVAKLDETGLESTAAHVSIDALEDDLNETYELYGETLGSPSAVVPYLSEEHFKSTKAIEETADRMAAIAADAAEYKWPVHYHNHAHEFVDFDSEVQRDSDASGKEPQAGITAFERFIELADGVGIELDVGWALVGGSDPVELIESYGDRIDLLHMKDMVTDEERGFREIGEGDVDMQACANAAHKADVEWFIYEHDEPENPTASIDTGAKYLDSL